MTNPLVQKLGSFNVLDAKDRDALDGLCQSSFSRAAGQHLIREGDRPDQVFLLVQGWAYRYKLTHDGSRQIMAYLIPGDLCDPHVFVLEAMDHSIALLTDAEVIAIPKQTIIDLTEQRPAIARAFWWSALVDEAVLREWLVNMGSRDAYERLAHLFCELWQRMFQVGLTRGDTYSLPVTQEQLGDTVGLTAVHVNRTLQQMRAAGLISTKSKQLTILEPERMKRAAGFDPKYLHLTARTNLDRSAPAVMRLKTGSSR